MLVVKVLFGLVALVAAGCAAATSRSATRLRRDAAAEPGTDRAGRAENAADHDQLLAGVLWGAAGICAFLTAAL